MNVAQLKELLKSYRGLTEYQEFALSELNRLEKERLAYMSSFGGVQDGMPRAPGFTDTVGNKVAAAMARYDTDIKLFQLGLEQSAQQLQQIRRLLFKLPHRGQVILWKHYCLGWSWEKTAGACHYSSRQTRRIAETMLYVLTQKKVG